MIQYLLDASVIWMIFYLVYHLLLRKETFFKINRLFLLSALPIGLLLPILRLLDFTLSLGSQAEAIVQPISTALSFEVVDTPVHVVHQSNLGFILIIGIYLLGVFYTALRMIKGLKQIFILYKNGTKSNIGRHYLIQTNARHLPFSFFNYVFWGNVNQIEGLDERKILAHELVHVKQYHSLDVIFLECLCILFWWNPIVYLYRQQIRQNHEFICDQGAQLNHTEFEEKMGAGLYGDFYLAMANQFFNSHLKNRIAMIQKAPSATWQRWKLMAIIPFILLIAAAFAFSVEQPSTKLMPLVKCTIDHKDIEAQYACTNKEILIHIYKSVRYPKEAREKLLPGYSILGATFNKDGLTSHKYLYETDPVFQAAMEDISNGLQDLQFNLGNKEELSLLIPVIFRLEGIDTTVEILKNEIPKNIEDKYPLFFKIEEAVVTGLAVSKELTSKATSTENIAIKEPKPSRVEHHDTASLRWAVNRESAIIKHGDIKIEADKILIEHDTNQVASTSTYDTKIPFFAPISEPSLFAKDTESAQGWSRDTEPLIILFDVNGEILEEHYGQVNPLRRILDPNDIRSIQVIKGSSAVRKYGPGAEHGVVAIYLKKKYGRKYIRSNLRDRKRDRVRAGRYKERSGRSTFLSKKKKVVPDDLNVYPNPANEYLNFSFESDQDAASGLKYYIVDLHGKIQGKIKDLQLFGKWEHTMNISHLTSGHYYLIIEENGARHQKAFEIVR